MKRALRTFLAWLLRHLSQLTIWKYRPGIVGVTGSVGKTSTKFAVAAVLAAERRVRASKGNLNNELGLPLAILGDWSERELALVSKEAPAGSRFLSRALFWAKVLFTASWRLCFGRRGSYPEMLVLEYGADKPGDIKYLLSVARPNVSIITAVGDVPVHVEFFSGPEEVAREKGRLIEYLPAAGFAVLNADDDTVMDLRDRTRAHLITFGFGGEAEVQVSRFEYKSADGRPAGISFKIGYGGSFVPVRIDGAFGKGHAYAFAAASAVGLIFGMNLVKISEALKAYRPAPHRMELVPAVKETYVIDDSYNASPLSTRAALEALRALPARRRVAVLGDMLEIGTYAIQAHESAGEFAVKCADVLVTVGPRAKFMAEAAEKAGMDRARVMSFDDAEDAADPVHDLLRKGDLVLVKGSHAMELGTIVERVRVS